MKVIEHHLDAIEPFIWEMGGTPTGKINRATITSPVPSISTACCTAM